MGQELITTLTRPANAPGQGQATGADILSATESGSLFNTVIIVLFAALGAVHLRRSPGLLGAPRIRVLATLICVYLMWALLTVLWSVDPGLSFRRYVQLLLVVLGSAGLGLGFYGASKDGQRVFTTHVVIAGFVSMCVLWVTVLLSGNIDLLDPSWGGAKDLGISTPIIYPVAFASFALAWKSRRHIRPLLSLACVLACLFSLMVIKGRFIAAFTFIIVSILPLFEGRASWKKALPYLILIGLVGYSVFGLAALGGQPAIDSIGERVWSYATLDTGGDTVGTLTGRTPLWEELMRYVAERPWAGYGFGAFWNPEIMPAIWSVVGWEAPVAHNGFLDEALATGAVGLVLFLAVWLTGLVQAVRLRLKHKDSFAIWVVTAMVFFLLCNLGDSLMQTYYRYPFWISLTALFALLGARAREEARVPGNFTDSVR